MITPKTAANISYQSSLPVNNLKYTAKKHAMTTKIVTTQTAFF